VTKRNRRMSRLPLMIVLLINTAVTGTGWAMNVPATTPEQPVAEHVHCGEAMEQMAGMASVPETHVESQHQHSPNGDCCTLDTCHCAPPAPTSDLAIVPLRAPLVRVASISLHEQGAFPTPDLPRLLRPPIA
jgi:hypothetical protein